VLPITVPNKKTIEMNIAFKVSYLTSNNTCDSLVSLLIERSSSSDFKNQLKVSWQLLTELSGMNPGLVKTFIICFTTNNAEIVNTPHIVISRIIPYAKSRTPIWQLPEVRSQHALNTTTSYIIYPSSLNPQKWLDSLFTSNPYLKNEKE
jgi:hypothetical protein